MPGAGSHALVTSTPAAVTEPRLPPAPLAAFGDDPGCVRADLLRRIGLVEFGWLELEHVAQRAVGDPVRLYGVSSAYVREERYHLALRILRRVPSRHCHARNLGWVVGHLVVHVGDRQRRQNVEAYRAFARGAMAWSEAVATLRRSATDVGQDAVLESAYLFPEPAEWNLLVRLDRLQTVEHAPVN